MSRIRTIKPDFWQDEVIAQLSLPARLLYIRLWNYADDNGQIEYSPSKLKVQIFPYDTKITPSRMEEWLGELVSYGRLVPYDVDGKKSEKVIGYFAYFRLINGFEKALFMKTEDVEKHGKRYSKSFAYPGSVWKTNFDAMSLKTVVKLLISKWGPMSVDMQRAITADQGTVINDGGKEGIPEVSFDDAVVVEPVAEPLKVETSNVLDDEAGTAQEPE